MYTLGSATVEGLRRLLDQLGALPGREGGPRGSYVVVTDLREELALYVNGTAYMRRELEMPAAALHHAGTCGYRRRKCRGGSLEWWMAQLAKALEVLLVLCVLALACGQLMAN